MGKNKGKLIVVFSLSYRFKAYLYGAGVFPVCRKLSETLPACRGFAGKFQRLFLVAAILREAFRDSSSLSQICRKVSETLLGCCNFAGSFQKLFFLVAALQEARRDSALLSQICGKIFRDSSSKENECRNGLDALESLFFE